MKNLLLITLTIFLFGCYYHPSEKYLKRCGFVKYNTQSPYTKKADQWLLMDSNFYYKKDSVCKTINYVYYYPVIHAWDVGVGREGYTLETVDFEINSKREYKLMLQDIVNQDSL